ncbi:hypothetical protein [Roseibium algae]|uniref:N-acetyl-gamma-glutamyl-phosphate reductase dimerisation domain-containing protein n=1 Tax=Roseibium algae TaxID=3123038 RepID=A0ABU8TRW6_9HYPH
MANPGCFPAATQIAFGPLLASKLIEPDNIVIDAKTGISGAGRGGGVSFAASNENLIPYGLLKHVNMPEIETAIEQLAVPVPRLVSTPHLVPMPGASLWPLIVVVQQTRRNVWTLPGATTKIGLSCMSLTSRHRPNGQPAKTLHLLAMPLIPNVIW